MQPRVDSKVAIAAITVAWAYFSGKRIANTDTRRGIDRLAVLSTLPCFRILIGPVGTAKLLFTTAVTVPLATGVLKGRPLVQRARPVN